MLRANSQLYTTLKSRRIDFVFYDLLQGGYCYDFSFGGSDGYYRLASPHRPDMFEAKALAASALK